MDELARPVRPEVGVDDDPVVADRGRLPDHRRHDELVGLAARVDAQRRIYTIDRTGLDNIDAWLRGIREFWSSRLDALEREGLEVRPHLRRPRRRAHRTGRAR